MSRWRSAAEILSAASEEEAAELDRYHPTETVRNTVYVNYDRAKRDLVAQMDKLTPEERERYLSGEWLRE